MILLEGSDAVAIFAEAGRPQNLHDRSRCSRRCRWRLAQFDFIGCGWDRTIKLSRSVSTVLGKIVNARNQFGWLAVSSDDGNAPEDGVGATNLRN